MGARRAEDGLCVAVHKVVSAAAVGMDIDKARRDVAVFDVDARVAGDIAHSAGADGFDQPALRVDQHITIFQHTPRRNDPAVIQKRFHKANSPFCIFAQVPCRRHISAGGRGSVYFSMLFSQQSGALRPNRPAIVGATLARP